MRLAEALPGNDTVYWLEGRPSEGGRTALVRCRADGVIEDALPPLFNVRSRVHEYGGGAYWVVPGAEQFADTLFFVDFADQRIYRVDPGEAPRAITPEPASPAADRHADGRVSPDGRWVVCVRERHVEGREAINELAILRADGSGEPRTLAGGADFYAAPRFSPDGSRLCWLQWDHPRMPWDGTELRVATFDSETGDIADEQLVAGGLEESVLQPEWSPDGVLHFISDRSGWWNLYALREDGAGGGRAEAIAPIEAELGGPMWALGGSRYAFLPGGAISCVVTRNGSDSLGLIRPGSGRVEVIDTPFVSLASLREAGGGLFAIGATASEGAAVIDLNPYTGETWVFRSAESDPLDREYVSTPEAIDFPTGGGHTAHGLLYRPRNPGFEGPAGERPPLLVLSHGGPTGSASPAYTATVQFWTTRGFAVVDVNYRGSAGYGRAYRRLLDGLWGIADVEDCVAAARTLVERGEVDGERLAIRGGSAGGYTTLCALTFHDVFKAGASYYGIADAELLAAETHKFESRYTDGLIAPYPEGREVYLERSPIHHLDRLSCPVILFQGLDDRVVPPSQAETMVAALKELELPHEYLAFEGEGHGFRKAETIVRALEAELSFYGEVLGFTPKP